MTDSSRASSSHRHLRVLTTLSFFFLSGGGGGGGARSRVSRSFSRRHRRRRSTHDPSISHFPQENEWRGLPVIGPGAARLAVFHSLRIQRSAFLAAFPHGGSNMRGNYRTLFFILWERDNETKAFMLRRISYQDTFYFVHTKRFKEQYQLFLVVLRVHGICDPSEII